MDYTFKTTVWVEKVRTLRIVFQLQYNNNDFFIILPLEDLMRDVMCGSIIITLSDCQISSQRSQREKVKERASTIYEWMSRQQNTHAFPFLSYFCFLIIKSDPGWITSSNRPTHYTLCVSAYSLRFAFSVLCWYMQGRGWGVYCMCVCEWLCTVYIRRKMKKLCIPRVQRMSQIDRSSSRIIMYYCNITT